MAAGDARGAGRLARIRAALEEGWQRFLDGAPPPPFELAVAGCIGGLGVALGNAVAIEVAVPWPHGGWPLRLQHHFFSALEAVGLAGLWGLLAATIVGHCERLRPLGWLLVSALSIGGMGWALGIHLERQADCVLGGKWAWLLLPAYVVLCGMAVPVAHWLGSACSRTRVTLGFALGLGVSGNVLAHVILRDDYPGVHTAILWTAVAMLGSALAPIGLRGLRSRRRRLVLLGSLAGLACLAVLWVPPNAVRLQLFRESGAVAGWVLARTIWSLPSPAGGSSRAAVPVYQPPEPRALPPLGRRFSRRPVVVLVTVEALRADVLSESTYDAQLRHLSSLRDHAAYFPRALAPGSQTSVTMTTMFTGQYFSQLRWAKHGVGDKRFLYAAGDPATRFPELLTDAGIGSSSFLGLIFLGSYFGISRGFAEETLVVQDRRHAMAPELMGPLFARLRRVGNRPHFFWVHLMEPHAPYDRGQLKEGSEWDRYISEVAEVDRWVGQLMRLMRKRFRGRGYVIVAGDHGEAFGEHGTRFHSKTLYEEMVRVPLLIWGPGVKAKRHEEPVGLVDLGPTILHLFRLVPQPGHMGESLLPLIEGRVDRLQRPLLAEGRLRRALFRRDGLKVIEDTVRKTVEVFDLRQDPAESRNVYDEERQRLEPPLAELRAFFERYTLRAGGYRAPFKR